MYIQHPARTIRNGFAWYLLAFPFLLVAAIAVQLSTEGPALIIAYAVMYGTLALVFVKLFKWWDRRNVARALAKKEEESA